jgi:hypothetical protein
MHRIDADANVANLFSDGNVGIGQPGTKVDAAWLNAVQEELAYFIELMGLTLDKASHTQLAQAIGAKFPVPTWTTIVPDSGAWTAASGVNSPRFWRDSIGVVHIHGQVQAAATPTYLINSGAPLPTWARPAGVISAVVVNSSNSALVPILVDNNGRIQVAPFATLPTSNQLIHLDLSFLTT